MSEQEKIDLFNRIGQGIRKAQRKMVERKATLGQTIIIADENGNPVEISAQEAKHLYS